MTDKPLSPKQCECGRQGHNKDSRQMLTHVYRRYNCECGQAWTTREVRVGSQEDKDKKLRESISDRLMELAREVKKEA
jgi:hypothetical protein